MPKMCYFRKKAVKIVVALEAPHPDSRVVAPTFYYNLISARF